MSNRVESDAEGSINPWSRPQFIIAAVIVGVIVAALIGVLIVSGLRSEKPPRTAAESSPPVASDSDSVCGLPFGEQIVPVTAPATEWELVGTMAVPTSRDIGPGRVEDNGFRDCFAHSPLGSLYAAVNAAALIGVDDLQEEAYQKLLVPGPGQQAVLESLRASEQTVDEVTVQIAGFRILSYTADAAVVDLAIRTSRGLYLSAVTHLEWIDGDWKFAVEPDGTEVTPVQQIPSTSGYIPWGGA